MMTNPSFMRAGLLAVAGLLVTSQPVLAQKPAAIPAKGQSAQQQKKDDGECQASAKSKTGIDPAALIQASPPQAKGGGEQAQAQKSQAMKTFNDAYRGCMSDRGYSVK